MGVLPSAVGALDTNRGDADVALAGLSFLAELAYFAENQVGVWWQCMRFRQASSGRDLYFLKAAWW